MLASNDQKILFSCMIWYCHLSALEPCKLVEPGDNMKEYFEHLSFSQKPVDCGSQWRTGQEDNRDWSSGAWSRESCAVIVIMGYHLKSYPNYDYDMIDARTTNISKKLTWLNMEAGISSRTTRIGFFSPDVPPCSWLFSLKSNWFWFIVIIVMTNIVLIFTVWYFY